MSDKEPGLTLFTYSEIPDETFTVEDFGVRATVNIWHSPISRIKTTFERLENTNDEVLAKDELWARQEKQHILTAKARLVAFQAISHHLHE
jgi:hypothetical protein